MAQKKEPKQQSVIGDSRSPPKTRSVSARMKYIATRNGGPGNEVDDWLKAETELKEGHPEK